MSTLLVIALLGIVALAGVGVGYLMGASRRQQRLSEQPVHKAQVKEHARFLSVRQSVPSMEPGLLDAEDEELEDFTLDDALEDEDAKTVVFSHAQLDEILGGAAEAVYLDE